MAKITWRIWMLIIVLLFSLLAIAPWKSLESGVLIKSVDQNSTSFESGLRQGQKIITINGEKIQNLQDYTKITSEIFINEEIRQKIIIETAEEEFIFLANNLNGLEVSNLPNSNLKTGLDLSGGARALVKAENESLTPEQLSDLVEITSQRFNAFGLTDVIVKPVSDLSGENYMLVEIAGSTKGELETLLESQGKFEANIGNETVFIGGERDITYVGTSGQDAGIYSCQESQGQSICQFRFVIAVSEEAAERQADITSDLAVNLSSGGRYLEKPLDLYVDGILLDTLQIGADLKGRVVTQIQISGSGTGISQDEAYDSAEQNMKNLQTILKTGSLPFKLQIVKLDTISPTLGEEFLKNLFKLALVVFIAISLVLFIRYRKVKLTLAVVLTMFSEIFITLAVATLLRWNLDVASIAGIIAGMGTGVDDQIVIIDESLSNKKTAKLKERIKRAFFIILAAFFTVFAAMLPLFWAGAGMLKGFALTTIISVTVGILITRPAFADIAEQIQEKEE